MASVVVGDLSCPPPRLVAATVRIIWCIAGLLLILLGLRFALALLGANSARSGEHHASGRQAPAVPRTPLTIVTRQPGALAGPAGERKDTGKPTFNWSMQAILQ